MDKTVVAVEKKADNHKYYPVLDLVRFVASILVILIHVYPDGATVEGYGLDNSVPTLVGLSFIHALLRIAVPVFFVISSFLLFKRIEEDQENKWKYIKKYCVRLLLLYAFWYVLGLPITIRDIVGYSSSGDTYNLIRYIVITLWKGAPRGYWFLVSLGLSVCLVATVKTKKSLIVLTIIAGLMYIYGCFNAAYFNVFKLVDNPISKALYTVGDYLELRFCPLQALLFVVLGRIFATHGTFSIKGNIMLISLSFLLMVGELFITQYFNLFVYPDAFFSLPIFVFFFMNLMIGVDTQNEKFIRVSKKLKKVGSFSYLFHIQFFCYVYWIFDSTGHNIFMDNFYLLIIPFVVCVILCFALQTLFEYLSKYKYLKFFRYSY